MTNSNIAVYPGTFDPVTKGHLDIIERASKITDKLIVAVSSAPHKTPILTLQERCFLLENDIKNYIGSFNIYVKPFEGLLVNFMKEMGAKFIIRGLRGVSDFEYEFRMAYVNNRLDNNLETLFLPASEKNKLISSQLIREIAALGGNITEFVSAEVEEKLKNFFSKK